MTKYVFVTGGVLSGVGKGITAATIGALLKCAGLRPFLCKLDPYLNVDPGTMSPIQHGEVFVTVDGAETDLDLGHYERFVDVPMTRRSSIISGQLYRELIEKERQGDFLGHTVQVIPHLTNLTKEKIVAAAAESKCDVMIVEIGGTVGDIESEFALESIRQLRQEVGEGNAIFVHVGFVPYLSMSRELKTKPLQHSVRELRRAGIQPDIIIARADHPISSSIIKKISLFCDVDAAAVIPAPNAGNIYEVPVNFYNSGIWDALHTKLKLSKTKQKIKIHAWETLQSRIVNAKKVVTVAMVGKYIGNGDSYLSVDEALRAAGWAIEARVGIIGIDPERLEKNDEKEWEKLKSADGIVVPGGFGGRGIEGKILAARYARTEKVPYLGLCLGSQIMMIELAREALQDPTANSEEFDVSATNKVVHIMEYQKGIIAKGGTMRLGSYDCILNKQSKSFNLYRKAKISERHRHRFECNNTYRDGLERAGMVFAGTSPDGSLVEIVEIRDHPFMIGSQFHPEFASRPGKPHPLFAGFIAAAGKGK